MCYISNIGSYRPVYNFPVSRHAVTTVIELRACAITQGNLYRWTKNTRLAAFLPLTKNVFGIHGCLRRSSIQPRKLEVRVVENTKVVLLSKSTVGVTLDTVTVSFTRLTVFLHLTKPNFQINGFLKDSSLQQVS